MAASLIEKRALGLLKAFEEAGRSVRSVTVDGRKISLVFGQTESSDEFDGIDMHHGKT